MNKEKLEALYAEIAENKVSLLNRDIVEKIVKAAIQDKLDGVVGVPKCKRDCDNSGKGENET